MTTGININHVCIKLIKTSLLSGELFDTSLPTAEDLDLCVRLYEKTDRYVFINSVLYRYNRTGYSLTSHDNGDAYIRRTSEIISTFGKYNNLSARLGGDEFAMLLYGYPSEKEVDEDIKAFHEMKDKYSLTLENGVSVPIRFSAGCVKIFGETDYHILMRRADESMYEDKRSRK